MCNYGRYGTIIRKLRNLKIIRFMKELRDRGETPAGEREKSNTEETSPLFPRPPAMEDLRFVVKASMALAGRFIQDLDLLLRQLNSREKK